ncbi:MAG: gliding motility-associated C-terminal domain-containing protein [Bacteroidota bacterium]
MKRFLLFGVLILIFNTSYSQTISQPDLWFTDACTGNPVGFNYDVGFTIQGTFNSGSEFVIELSDKTGDFSSPTELTRVAYVDGQSDYPDNIVVFDNSLVDGNSYKIRIRSTSPEVFSSESDSITIVSSEELVITADGDTSFCSGGSVTLRSDASVFLTWFKDGVEIVGENSSTLLVTESGQYSIRAFLGICYSESNIIEVVSTNVPTSVIDPNINPEICSSEEFTFKANSIDIDNPVYTWYDESNNVVGTGEEFTTGIAGTYYLETSNHGACSDVSEPVTLTVYDGIAEIEQSSPIKLCEGSDVVLTSKEKNTEYIYHWFKDGIEIIQGIGLIEYSIPGLEINRGKYHLEVETPACNVASADVEVIIKAVPVFSIVEGDQDGCKGDWITLTSSLVDTEYNYQWYYKNSPLVDSISTSIDINISTVTEGDYKLEMNFGGACPVMSDPVTVAMHDFVAEIEQSGPIATCEGTDVVLLSKETNASYTYHWFKDGAEVAQGVGMLEYTVAGLEANSGKYHLEVESPACIYASTGVDVKIKAVPVFSIVEGDQDGCKGDWITLTSSLVDPDYDYQWYFKGSPLVDSTSTSIDVNISTVTEGDYKLEMNFGGACSVMSDPVTIVMHDFVAEIEQTGPIATCEGTDVVLLSKETNASYTYHWFKDGTEVAQGVGMHEYTVTGFEWNSGKYHLEVESPSCTYISEEVEVVVKAVPYSKIIGEFDEEKCEGSEITLQSELDDPDYTYEWYFEGKLISGANTSDLNIVVSDETAGTYNLIVSYGLCAGLTAPDEVVILMANLEAQILGDGDVEMCNGSSVVLTATAIGNGLEFEWYKDDILITGEKSENLVVSEDGEYKSKVTSDKGCSQMTDIVSVSYAQDNMGVHEDVINISVGEIAEFRAYGGVEYEWYRDGVLVYDESNTYAVSPQSNTSYQLKITNETGCEKVIVLKVIVEGLTAKDIRNLITPNGDGKNDVWTIPEGLAYSGDVEVTILTRQGSIVLQTVNYQNDWGGAYNGNLLPAATYFYVIKQKDKEPIMGSITLLR